MGTGHSPGYSLSPRQPLTVCLSLTMEHVHVLHLPPPLRKGHLPLPIFGHLVLLKHKLDHKAPWLPGTGFPSSFPFFYFRGTCV